MTAYATGTATDAENLLALFRTFITSNASLVSASEEWTENAYSNVSSNYELYLQGPGLAGTDEIYVAINLFNDTSAGSDAWSWCCYGATGYSSSLPIDQQPGSLGYPKVMPLYDQSMPYWFFANGRRFIIIAQVTTSVYVGCYCGFILPFSPAITALEYTYPLYIGASMSQTGRRFSTTDNSDHRAFWDPSHDLSFTNSKYGGYIYTPGNFWVGITNVDPSGGTKLNVFQSSSGITEPYSSFSTNGGFFLTLPTSVENVEPLLGGDYLLKNVVLSRPNSDLNITDRYGVLDGVAHITGVSQSSQNTVTVGSDTYIVFQRAGNTGQGDYVAIKQ